MKRIHERVAAARQNDQPVIIVGETGHPEVEGILGWAGENAFVVYSDTDVDTLPPLQNAVVVAQTTLPEEKMAQRAFPAFRENQNAHTIFQHLQCHKTPSAGSQRNCPKSRQRDRCWQQNQFQYP